MRHRLLNCLPPDYTVYTLVANAPLWGVFNRASGCLHPADYTRRCDLLLMAKVL